MNIQLWENNAKGDDELAEKMLPWALASGRPNAVEVAIKLTGSPDLCECHQKKRVWNNIRKYTGYKSNKKDFPHWFKQNKGKLRYDKRAKKFTVNKP
ncbi:MAG: hypothetical protein GY765_23075 [bacterium]|nr:hypothetical protein [bacterium]